MGIPSNLDPISDIMENDTNILKIALMTNPL